MYILGKGGSESYLSTSYEDSHRKVVEGIEESVETGYAVTLAQGG